MCFNCCNATKQSMSNHVYLNSIYLEPHQVDYRLDQFHYLIFMFWLLPCKNKQNLFVKASAMACGNAFTATKAKKILSINGVNCSFVVKNWLILLPDKQSGVSRIFSHFRKKIVHFASKKRSLTSKSGLNSDTIELLEDSNSSKFVIGLGRGRI